MSHRTIVHLLRHGEVHNPEQVLYGRLPDFHLSDLGREMAERAAEALAGRDIAVVTASPLERAQETAAPIAAAHGLPVGVDDRPDRGRTTSSRASGWASATASCSNPAAWRHLCNPFTPSLGRALRRDRGAHAHAVRRGPRRGARPRGGAGQPPAADLGRAAWTPRTAASSTTRAGASAPSRR